MSGDFVGFISYSRRASASLATDLQTAVERFAKPWYQLRAVRIFRDDATMSANTALWPTIESALVSAEWLILLTSPAAAASQWVGNEVRWWLEHKSADRIVIVLEEGPDLVWDAATGDFDWPDTTNLPPALRGAFPEEPRWIDLRWYEQEGSLQRADPRWQERVADVAAAVRFTERDQLIGENVREHRRALRLLRAGVVGLSLLLVASLVASVIAILQGREADRQADIARAQEREATTQARIALARQLAAQADALAPTDLRTASLLAVQAFRTNDDAQTRAMLFQMATANPQMVRTLDVGSYVGAVSATPDGVVITGSDDGRVLRWDGPEATEILSLGGPVGSVAVSDDGSVVAAVGPADEGPVVVWRDGQSSEVTEAEQPRTVAVAPDGSRLAVTSGFDGTQVWDLEASGTAYLGRAEASGSKLAFGDQGLGVFGAGAFGPNWSLLDGATVVEQGQHGFSPYRIPTSALSADGSTYAVAQGDRDYRVWRGAATYSDRDENATAATDLSEPAGIALSSDGRRLATFATGQVTLAYVTTRATVRRPVRLGGVAAANLEAIAFGGTQHLVTASGSEALVWDVDQLFRFGRQVPAELNEGCNVCRLPVVSLSADGRDALVTTASSLGPSTTVVDLADGRQRVVDAVDDDVAVSAADWLDDGRVVGISGDEIVVEDVETGGWQPVATATGGAVALVSDGSPDGQVTRLDNSGLVETVDLQTGEVVRSSKALGRLVDADQPWLLGIAPDQSSAFISLALDGVEPSQVAVVDLDTDRVTVTELPAGVVGATYDASSRLHLFDGTQAYVLQPDGTVSEGVRAEVEAAPPVVVDATGTLAITGGADGVVRLVDLTRQGAEFGTFAVPQGDDAWAISAFTADGSAVVTAIQPVPAEGFDSNVRVMSLEPEDWVVAACAVAARDLTVEDWERYGVGDPPSDLRCVR